MTPESLTYTITNASSGVVVRTATVTPNSSTYTVSSTIADNTLTSGPEERKVVVHWVYSGGTKGDSILEHYRIKEVK